MSSPARNHRPGLAANTLWTWASVAANVSVAVFVSPLIIRRLGDEAYGLWALVFSISEYYTLVDMGIKSAVVKYVAEHWALGEAEELNRTVNTGFVYLAATAGCMLLLTLVIAPLSPGFFVIAPNMQATFVYMGLAMGATWAVSIVFLCFSSCLEAVQRFDISNRILIASNVTRAIVVLGLLRLGFGLPAVVTAAVAARLLQCVLLWRAFNRHFPTFQWRLADIDRATFRKLVNFGVNTVPATMGSLLLIQGPGIVIGHVLPARFVGYYALPSRLIQSVLELVYRAGLITTPRSAELGAHRQREALIKLAVKTNRYSMVVFMPAVVFLTVYGNAVFSLWLTPQFAAMSAPLLPFVLLGTLLADAAQFNSSSMLYGLGKHQTVSRLLLVESALSMLLIYHFAIRADLVSAAAASAALMVLNRGVVTPYLLCRHLTYPVGRFVVEIAAHPLAAGLFVAATLWVCRVTWLAGKTGSEIGLAIAICASLYFLVASRYCVLPEDQRRVLDVLCEKLPFLERPAERWLGLHILKSPLSLAGSGVGLAADFVETRSIE